MDQHKILYKDQGFHAPHQHRKKNRELQEANRNKRRNERFQVSRNISPSPVRHKEVVPVPLFEKDKENDSTQEGTKSIRLLKTISFANESKKLSKQEAYIKRFIEWKARKAIENREKLVEKKKIPFVSAVNYNRKENSTSFVPSGHHEGFRAPIELKAPTIKNVEKNENFVQKGRQSIYTAKVVDEKLINKISNVKNFQSKILHTSKKSNEVAKASDIASTSNNTNIKVSTEKSAITGTNPVKTKAKAKPVSLAKPFEKNEITPKVSSTNVSTRANLKSCVLKMPPPSTKPPSTAQNRARGAINKIKDITKKREQLENIKPKFTSKAGGARLGINLKNKKNLANRRDKSSFAKISGITLRNLLLDPNTDEDMLIHTPRDFSNHFDEFVTSTIIKNSDSNDNIERVSSKRSSIERAQYPVKRSILQDSANTTVEKKSDNAKYAVENVVKKYNFIRYSEAGKLSDRNGNSEMQLAEEKTPIKCGPEERPVNYLSPFVSVTRGKVSLKKEREKRNSIYMQNANEANASIKEVSQNSSSKHSIENRRTLEAVLYFRKQLQNEIDRLTKLCDIWEEYKIENLDQIQNSSGEDMINVTIGQTRLLTNKKFMQFKGLIDRCEARATGIGDVENDGSEDTKPITSGDLEGFWSMLGIQIENLDQRFTNLNRWQANKWIDPDENKLQTNKKIIKVKKSKATATVKGQPNLGLLQMIRKRQAEMRKNKNDDSSEVVFLMSSKLQQQNTTSNNNTSICKVLNTSAQRRVSIKVRDRKYFSPAATRITFSSPNREVSKSLQESPKIIHQREKFNEALDNMETSLGLRKSVLMNENSRRSNHQLHIIEAINKNYNESSHRSPSTRGRKSILKTPGTPKNKVRNVIFNEKLRVKKFNFLINEDGTPFNVENGMDTHEDVVKDCEEQSQSNDVPQRTLTLRSRKVQLRQSCEIVIPLKKGGD